MTEFCNAAQIIYTVELCTGLIFLTISGPAREAPRIYVSFMSE